MLRDLVQASFVHVDSNDPPALGNNPFQRGAPNARTGTGNYDGLVLESLSQVDLFILRQLPIVCGHDDLIHQLLWERTLTQKRQCAQGNSRHLLHRVSINPRLLEDPFNDRAALRVLQPLLTVSLPSKTRFLAIFPPLPLDTLASPPSRPQ